MEIQHRKGALGRARSARSALTRAEQLEKGTVLTIFAPNHVSRRGTSLTAR